MTLPTAPADIVSFWREAGNDRWFARDDAFDAEISARFETAHHAAARGEFDAWSESSEGALALLLLLDQFPRNLYRNSAHAWATDGLARAIAAEALRRGFDQQADQALRAFYYLPFEHSENADDQAVSVAMFEALGDEEYLRFARLHAEIIGRFGRFPHRNRALGRATTPDEARYLAEGGFAG